jgi:uncharacterized coiled-coil DUF342 family protein
MNTEEKLKNIKELADKMYSRMAYLTSDTRPIREAMEEYHQFIINEYHKEEPVSEDLEEASRNYADNEEYGDDEYFAIKAAFKVGAQWQKEHHWKPSDEMLEALYMVIPENVMEKSEDEMLLDKLYQGLKYGKVLSEK